MKVTGEQSESSIRRQITELITKASARKEEYLTAGESRNLRLLLFELRAALAERASSSSIAAEVLERWHSTVPDVTESVSVLLDWLNKPQVPSLGGFLIPQAQRDRLVGIRSLK